MEAIVIQQVLSLELGMGHSMAIIKSINKTINTPNVGNTSRN